MKTKEKNRIIQKRYREKHRETLQKRWCIRYYSNGKYHDKHIKNSVTYQKKFFERTSKSLGKCECTSCGMIGYLFKTVIKNKSTNGKYIYYRMIHKSGNVIFSSHHVEAPYENRT